MIRRGDMGKIGLDSMPASLTLSVTGDNLFHEKMGRNTVGVEPMGSQDLVDGLPGVGTRRDPYSISVGSQSMRNTYLPKLRFSATA
jgi:hypothetical protein